METKLLPKQGGLNLNHILYNTKYKQAAQNIGTKAGCSACLVLYLRFTFSTKSCKKTNAKATNSCIGVSCPATRSIFLKTLVIDGGD